LLATGFWRTSGALQLSDLISAMTTQAQFPFQIELAHVMAHEIGHALLGHTTKRIMAPGVGQEQFRRMQMGILLFCSEQKMQLHERIRAQQHHHMVLLQASN
jgi:hypothetical protein